MDGKVGVVGKLSYEFACPCVVCVYNIVYINSIAVAAVRDNVEALVKLDTRVVVRYKAVAGDVAKPKLGTLLYLAVYNYIKVLTVVARKTCGVVHVDVRVDTEELSSLACNAVGLDRLHAETLSVLAVPARLLAVEVSLAPVACEHLYCHILKLGGELQVVLVGLELVYACVALLELCAGCVLEHCTKDSSALCTELLGQFLVEAVELVPVCLKVVGAYLNLLNCPVCSIGTCVPAYHCAALRCCIVHTVAVACCVFGVECVVVACCADTVEYCRSRGVKRESPHCAGSSGGKVEAVAYTAQRQCAAIVGVLLYQPQLRVVAVGFFHTIDIGS